MRKITLFLSLVFCVMLTQAQNLLTNPGFETWTSATAPDGWLFDKTTATLTKESVVKKTGAASLKIVTTATYWVTQNIPVVAGKTYTLTLSYYINGGDGTDFRIWSNFYNLNGTTQVWNTMNLSDSLALKGPGGNLSTAYFPNETGAWKTYSYDVVAPQNFTNFSFQVRTYTGSTIYLDDFFFGEKTTGINNLNINQFVAIVSGKNLLLNNVANGSTVEIYSALGSKIQTSVIENGKVGLNNLTRGMYVVRVNNMTQKIMF
jgi:hypothetical protein